MEKDNKISFSQIARDFGINRKTITRLYNKQVHCDITSKFTFAPREPESMLSTLREAAVYLCISGKKKKDIEFRKLLDRLSREYFDIAYDYTKLTLR